MDAILIALGACALAQAAPAPSELSLDGARALALERNLGLQIEVLATEAAMYRYRATGGTFDWVYDANLAYTDQRIEPSDFFSASNRDVQQLTTGFTRPLETGGNLRASFESSLVESDSSFAVDPRASTDLLTLAYSQPLLRGAWRDYATASMRQGEKDWARQRERERQARQKLLLDVTNAYWDLVAAEAELGVAASGVDLARRQVEQSQKRLDAGLGVRTDVLQAETELAQREQERLAADNRLRASSDGLKQLLFPGSDRGAWARELKPSTPLPALASGLLVPRWEAALAVAIDRRAELRQQRLAVEVAEVRRDVARSDARPQLDFDLSASSQGYDPNEGEALASTSSFDYPTFRAGLAFSTPLGNTTARNQLSASWSELRAEKLRYDQLETSVLADVRDAVRQAEYQIEAVRAAQKSLELAREQLEAERARLENDQSTVFQVLQFQQELVRAMSVEVLARSNLAKSRTRLEAAQGTLGEASAP